MTTKIAYWALYLSNRSRIDHSAVLIVLMLTALFTSAILAATRPPPLLDLDRAAIQGGL